MEKAIYFDMDGTIADLYHVSDWLQKLDAQNSSPYLDAAPMIDMYDLYNVLCALKQAGFKIGVISWNSKHGSKEYWRAVREAKKNWLIDNGIYELFDEFHVVKYGTSKHCVGKIQNSLLFDDDKNVREKWSKAGRCAIDPVRYNIIDVLYEILTRNFTET